MFSVFDVLLARCCPGNAHEAQRGKQRTENEEKVN
jgi:hypothetical protein